jgi:hypothetical protein
MSETKNLEIVEETEVAIPEKPYTFRLLGAPDIFLMSKIISKIGIKEFKTCFESEGIKSLIQNAMIDKAQKDGDDGDGGDDTNIISAGAEIALDLASVILTNLPKCENDIYKMLSQTSNLSVEEIKSPGNAVMFLEMVIDFIKKEEFRDFIKVVSKLF